MKWKRFSYNWPFVGGIHQWPMDSPQTEPFMRSFDVCCQSEQTVEPKVPLLRHHDVHVTSSNPHPRCLCVWVARYLLKTTGVVVAVDDDHNIVVVSIHMESLQRTYHQTICPVCWWLKHMFLTTLKLKTRKWRSPLNSKQWRGACLPHQLLWWVVTAHCARFDMYCQIYNIRGTKSQNLNVSRLMLPLSLLDLLKSGVKLRMKM